ncbi:hypothetical protein SAMN05444372_11414 [Flavobacterium micromati]|uniref:Uncharacterized protein n=1 Tax=Flavobacterium micromati TaxID=229205 RepID=A0A1M5PZE5_9FLAO|nr:hypothetical protein [Flavobacterium micromati]SHH07062.1 hypothetical protein SAMN05444372_11414 [Flavobacterium micromati]
MKILTAFFLLLFLGKGCDGVTAQDMKTVVIEYTASSRGFYQKITVKNQTIMVSKDRNGDDKSILLKINASDWDELVSYFKEVQLDHLVKLKAPTEKRLYDGAAVANLKITFDEKNYETANFDHGFPPKEIKQLVDKVNSLIKK